MNLSDPLAYLAALSEIQTRYPVKAEQPPASFRRNQLIVAAVLIGVPLLVDFVLEWLEKQGL